MEWKFNTNKLGYIKLNTYLYTMQTITILPRTRKHTYEFYTEDHNGIEIVHGVKTLIHPDKCKLYIKLQKEGFVNNRKLYGFREI